MTNQRRLYMCVATVVLSTFSTGCSSPEVAPPKVSSPDETLVTYTVTGMTCEGCEGHLRSEMAKLPNVTKVVASHKAKKAWIIVKGEAPSRDAVKIAILAAGEKYKLVDDEE